MEMCPLRQHRKYGRERGAADMPLSAGWWEKNLHYVTFEQRPSPNPIIEVSFAFR